MTRKRETARDRERASRAGRLQVVALLLACGLAGPVFAQGAKAQPAAGKAPAAVPAAQPPAPVSADPANTSATYGDWVLRCQRIGEPDKQQKVCEVSQTIQVQNQRDPVAEIALGRLPNEPMLRLTAALPPSVSFPSTVQVEASTTPPQAVQLQWKRCLPGGCFAEAVPGEEVLKAWRGHVGAGKISFKDAGARDVALPISFRGLAQALDALGR